MNQTANSSNYLTKISQLELTITVSLYAVLLLIVITANGLVLSAFLINKHLRTATNTLVMGLAVSDILVGFVSIPCWLLIFTSYHEHSTTTQTTYTFYITFDIFIGGASILQLTALSVERCHAIVRPLRHRTLSIKVFYVMIAIPWLYAAIIASLQPVQFAGDWQDVYTLLVAFTCFIIPFVVIFFAYLFIYRFARNQPGKRSICQHRAVRQAYKKDLKLSVTLALITGLFVAAWLPLFVVTMIGTYYPQHLPLSTRTYRVTQLVKFCHYGNSALNPVVYAFRNSEMIATFRYIARALLCKEHQVPSPLSRTSSLGKSSLRGNSFTGSLRRSSFKGGSHREKSPLKKEELEGVNNRRERKCESLVLMYSTV
ncbi:adenosine receptor A1-like [Stylophora pistillata]|uniref:adenosine receptor A1-like n=1 Tax=Stylophora pistillata TaxID=50429 RepID=UPI000C03C30E|nr:adenosine receptor A1-like [Stylophora pistillata]XP_022788050.1 adenosine receptor A1-like [Stylophora pistillata]